MLLPAGLPKPPAIAPKAKSSAPPRPQARFAAPLGSSNDGMSTGYDIMQHKVTHSAEAIDKAASKPAKRLPQSAELEHQPIRLPSPKTINPEITFRAS
jgi:hypothetical protein